MRILVVGAGAVGGYFGGRLLEAGRDVTFLVRPRRVAELATRGLLIHSRLGDAHLPAPPSITADRLRKPYDLILLACKSYHLDDAMTAFAPAVGESAAILPLLNGMRHLDLLDTRFGAGRTLGGKCVIAATLNDHHEVVHLNDAASLSFGERAAPTSERVAAISRQMDGARFAHNASPSIILEMWEKWVFLATLAGATCLMRAAVGDITAAPQGADFVLRLLEECRSISASNGNAPRPDFLVRCRKVLTAPGSQLTASMMRDLEAGAPIEADHIIGDLLARGRGELLQLVFIALKSYEHRRALSELSTQHAPG